MDVIFSYMYTQHNIFLLLINWFQGQSKNKQNYCELFFNCSFVFLLYAIFEVNFYQSFHFQGEWRPLTTFTLFAVLELRVVCLNLNLFIISKNPDLGVCQLIAISNYM